MKKSILLFSLYLLFPLYISAQYFNWAEKIYSQGTVDINVMHLDHSGNVILAGDFSNNTDFDPGLGVLNVNSVGGDDVFVEKLSPNGNLLWFKRIYGTSTEYLYDMVIDNNDNIYFTGAYSSSNDFDPGTGVASLSGSGIYICKYDSNGNFLWVKSLPGGGYENSIEIDSNGNLLIAGKFLGTLDIDPGGLTNNITASTGGPYYVVKLNSQGSFIWGKNFGYSTSTSSVGSIKVKVNSLGEVYLTGSCDGTRDFMPGTGVVTLTPNGSNIYTFISKFSESGNFMWATKIFGAGTARVEDMVIGNNFNLFFSGSYSGTVDFNPGAAVNNLLASYSKWFVCKLDSGGNYLWAKSLGSNTSCNASLVSGGIALDTANNVYTSGNFCGTADFDPGSGIYNLTGGSNNQIFLSKLTSNGNFVWAHQLNSVNNDFPSAIDVDMQGNVYSTGEYQVSIDCNPSPTDSFKLTNSGSNKAEYIIKWYQDACSYTSYSLDSIRPVQCSDSGYVVVTMVNGLAPYTYMWNNVLNNDEIFRPEYGGIYQVKITDARNCVDSITLLIGGPRNNAIGQFDLAANLVSTSFRPGFFSNIELNGFNYGCLPVSGQLKLIADGLLQFNNSVPGPDNIQGDTLIWNFTNLGHDSVHITPSINFYVPASAVIGDSVHLKLIMTPITGDGDTTNNVKAYSFPVINGYDPNDIQVFPIGNCVPHYIDNNQLLTYTVRFQNTGNASAININILDSLDTDLDLTSVKVVGSSHSVVTEVLSGNVLKFRFDGINLPKSAASEALSRGYIIFEVFPNSGLAQGTYIENRARIHFDFNPAIITNTVFNTISNNPYGATSSTINISACNSYVLNGQTYTSNGNYTQILSNVYGCDSTIHLNLIINPNTTNVISETVCNSYTLNGVTYSISGLYTQQLSNVLGCDSTIYLNLIVNNSSNSINTSACDSYTINNQTYSASGTYIQILPNALGCDSILTINLTINQPTTFNIVETVCDSYIAPDGSIYNSSGIKTAIVPNAMGCDSTITIDLTINQPSNSTISEVACDSYSAPDGAIYTTSGTKTAIIPNTTGCDSIITIQLTVNSINDAVTQNGLVLTAIAGDSYQWIDCSNSNLIVGETSQTFTPTNNGNYAVVITENGCTDTSACYAITSIGLMNIITNSTVSIIPNPTNGIIEIKWARTLDNLIIEITNILGQTITKEQKQNGNSVIMEIPGPAGLYFVTITDNKGYKSVVKVIKE